MKRPVVIKCDNFDSLSNLGKSLILKIDDIEAAKLLAESTADSDSNTPLGGESHATSGD